MTPLSGWRVLLPRSEGRASSLVDLLWAEGAVAQAIPMIAIHPPSDLAALDGATMALSAGEYDWVGFTSVNAVDAMLRRAERLALHPVISADTRVAAVGPATTAALRGAGFPVDLNPERGGSAAALASIWPTARTGESVLLPQSEIAARTLADALWAKGYMVEPVVAYRTLPVPPAPSVAADLADGRFEAVLFTSPSTVDALASTVIAPGTAIGVIGPTTAAAAGAAGLPIAFTATDPTDAALIAGLVAHATRHPLRRSTR
ncbi:uroporphyrinogen-III synthase [Nakamurella panacisegetis]|uniref:Uroporphyrinogen-III synthase n=1 Tax=Nakamurella panacisegetis TaxID=1090615 RepID=A0A1H0HTL9_9ACTN|nr:uroporphyrinogen-III synthase [Nakamurella panacisegetis]SDO22526.1 uroporphyrinogen-III synthase [Nakamurella panacisegetis]